MRRILLVTLAVALSATAVLANRYKDCVQTKNVDRAIRGCTQIIERGKRESRRNRNAAFNNRAIAYHKKGQVDLAIADLRKALAIDPTNEAVKEALAKVYTNRGAAYVTKGDLDRAIADFAKAIEIDPKVAKAYSNRAAVYVTKGEFDRAIADSIKAIEIDPKFAMAYFNRGRAYSKKGDRDRAIADYTKATEFDPKYAAAYANRGLAYARKGDAKKAEADFRKVLEIDPSNEDAKKLADQLHVAAASADLYEDCNQNEDPERTVRGCTQIIERGDKETRQARARAYTNRSLAYTRKGEFERGIADSAKAIEIDPNLVSAYLARGSANHRKGDKEKAIADFRKALEIDPSNQYAKDNLANVECSPGQGRDGQIIAGSRDFQIRACTQIIERAHGASPETIAAAYANRGNAHSFMGEKDRAIADYGKAIEINPNDPHPYSGRGAVYINKGEFERAIADFTKAVAVDPRFFYAYRGRGIAYSKKGNKEKAAADFRMALAINPSDQFAKDNLKALGVAEAKATAAANIHADCNQSKDPKRQIRGCTQIIERGDKETAEMRSAAYVLRGLHYLNEEDYHRAIADLTKAIELDSKFGDAYYLRGRSYFAQKDYDRAIVDETKAIELDPKRSSAYWFRGKAYSVKGLTLVKAEDSTELVERAISDFDKVIEFDPKSAVGAYVHKGIIYKILYGADKNEADKKLAVASFRKALEIDPSSQDAQRGLSDLGSASSTSLER